MENKKCPVYEAIDYNKEIDRLYKKAFPISYKKDEELEYSIKKWEQYIKANQGKIRLSWSIFDDIADY